MIIEALTYIRHSPVLLLPELGLIINTHTPTRTRGPSRRIKRQLWSF